MMGNDGGVSCASFVMMVMAMTVNCGGGDGVIDDYNVVRLPSPTGPRHRAVGKHVFRPRGTAKPIWLRFRSPPIEFMTINDADVR